MKRPEVVREEADQEMAGHKDQCAGASGSDNDDDVNP